MRVAGLAVRDHHSAGRKKGTDGQPDDVVLAVLDQEQLLAALGVTGEGAVSEAAAAWLLDGVDHDARSTDWPTGPVRDGQ